MPNLYDATGRSAGDECTSTLEGRHLTFLESYMVHPSHTDGFVDEGDPVLVYTSGDQAITGWALQGAAAATDYITIDTEGVRFANVVAEDDDGNSAIVIGDEIFINKTTAVLSKIRNATTNRHFGYALSALASGETDVVAVKSHWDPDEPLVDQKIFVVSKGGNDNFDGSWDKPLLTIQAALDAVTADRKTIYILDGTYDEPLTWPTISGVKLIGMNRKWGVVLTDSSEEDAVVTVTPGVQTATWEMWLENIYIDHANAGQDGLAIDNTAMTKKLNVYLHDVGGDAASASDKFIVTTQGDTDNAICIYWNGDNGSVEGLIYLDAGNDGDRFYATNVTLNGGLQTAADAVAFDIRLIKCVVLHEGITGGNAAQTVHSVCSYSNTGATFAALDTNDLAGSHTEDIVA